MEWLLDIFQYPGHWCPLLRPGAVFRCAGAAAPGGQLGHAAGRHAPIKIFNSFANWLDKKVQKHRKSIETVGFWGLVLFVGIPLPGTGAWTGCLVATLLELDRKKSFLAAVLGVLMASIIMMIVSFGIPALLGR